MNMRIKIKKYMTVSSSRVISPRNMLIKRSILNVLFVALLVVWQSSASRAFDPVADTKSSTDRAWLGVGIQNITDDIAESMGLKIRAGALINKIEKGGPASKSSLKIGDTIIAVNGNHITGTPELIQAISTLKPNSTAEIMFYRDGRIETVQITLGHFPKEKEVSEIEEGKSSDDKKESITKKNCTENRVIQGRAICVSEDKVCEPSAEYYFSMGSGFLWRSHPNEQAAEQYFDKAMNVDPELKQEVSRAVAMMYLLLARSWGVSRSDEGAKKGDAFTKKAKEYDPSVDSTWVLKDVMRAYTDPYFRSFDIDPKRPFVYGGC